MTDAVKLLILHTVIEESSVYLKEIQLKVQRLTGFEVSHPTALCGYLKETNFSRQKMKLVAKQRDEDLRSAYKLDVSIYSPSMLVFIDETGTDKRDYLRRYGYSLRGKTPSSFKMLVRGERISVIGIMTTNGILDFHVVHGTTDGAVFLEFIELCLLPCLMPFNGVS